MVLWLFVHILLLRPLFHSVDGARVERIEYSGWRDSYRISNSISELVYVPQIGRIMRFGYKDGPNLLWENSRLAGMTFDREHPSKDWMNFGGDKLWPAPQDRWGWPPDAAIDAGNAHVDILPGGTVRISGHASKKHGIRFIREITLDTENPAVTIRNTMENTSGTPQEWSIWEVCQVNSPTWIGIPVSRSGKFKDGYYAFKDASPEAGFLKRTKDQVRVIRNPKKSAKIGSDSRRGFVTANVGGRQLTLSIVRPGEGNYPDSGCVEEIYTNADPDKYIEMEVLSPIRKLKPGERFTMNTRLEITHGDR